MAGDNYTPGLSFIKRSSLTTFYPTCIEHTHGNSRVENARACSGARKLIRICTFKIKPAVGCELAIPLGAAAAERTILGFRQKLMSLDRF
jgi:hypothetical protein